MQNKRGLSLIVLIVTLIVMATIAGAVLLTLTDAGIIGTASSTVDLTNMATIKDLVDLAWSEAYASGARTEQQFRERIDKKLKEHNVNVEEYGIYVTTSGARVGWKQEGLTLTRGTTVLTVGDDIQYDETVGKTVSVPNDVKWKVLGAGEDGTLLIMSTSNVGNIQLGEPNKQDLEQYHNDWLTGIDQMNKICEPYGKGKQVVATRSLTVEDVNKLTGYDPATGGYGKAAEGEDPLMYEYGNQVTYTYNGTIRPKYSSSNGLSGKLKTDHPTGFYYYKENALKADLNKTSGTITRLTASYYAYNTKDLGTLSDSSEVYNMIFNPKNTATTYLLASKFVDIYVNNAYFGFHMISTNGQKGYHYLCDTTGTKLFYIDRGVRAVVALDAKVQFNGNAETGWIIK